MMNYFLGICGGKCQFGFCKDKEILLNRNFVVFAIIRNSLLSFDKYCLDRVVLHAKMSITKNRFNRRMLPFFIERNFCGW